MSPRAGSPYQLPLIAILVAALAFLAVLDSSFVTAGAVFEYPLDDPYIHLAMAEQISAGGYGVNAGEFAAAASSPLFPVLLVPFAGTENHRWMLLFWNCVGLIAATALWGRILWQSGYGNTVLGVLLAILAPLTLHMAGLATTGMEHTLHLAASLAIVSGLLRFIDEGSVGWLLIAGVLLSPLLRFEGLALAILAALAVFMHRRWAAGTGILILAIAPVAAYAFVLNRIGLEIVPSSVSAKLALPNMDAQAVVDFIGGNAGDVFSDPQPQVLLAFILAGVALMFSKSVRRSGRGLLVLVVCTAGAAHLAFGRFGWMDRYEIYILCTVAAGVFAAAIVDRSPRLSLLPVLPLLLAGSVYLPSLIYKYPTAGRAIYVQQAQMGRFAKEYLNEPVAVNDLGHVAWLNPNYVLDLWGLASHEARRHRLQNSYPGWAGELTDARDVRFAMLYDNWFSQELGKDWILLGKLRITVTAHFLGGDTVNFFLTRPIDPAPFLAKIAAWKQDLPKGATFEFSPGLELPDGARL